MINLERGTPLTVLTERQRFNPAEGITAYFLEDVDDSTIKVTIPSGEESDIPQWSLLTVRFGMDSTSYMFCAQVVETSGEQLKLRLTSGLMRAQRRGDIRLEILREVTGTIEGSDVEFKGVVMDISAGGMSMRTNIPLSRGDRLKVALPIAMGAPSTTVECEVRWNIMLQGDSLFAYQTGCLFKFPHRVDKERLLKYIFRVQRNKLHKFDE